MNSDIYLHNNNNNTENNNTNNSYNSCHRPNNNIINKNWDSISNQSIEESVNTLLALPDNTKIDIIYKLSKSLSTVSLQNLSQQLHSLFHFDILTRLPHELSIKILAYTDCSTIYKVSQVSKRWYHLSQDNGLWRELYQNQWGSVPYIEKRISYYYHHYPFYFQPFQEELNVKRGKGITTSNFLKILNLLEEVQWKEKCRRCGRVEGEEGEKEGESMAICSIPSSSSSSSSSSFPCSFPSSTHHMEDQDSMEGFQDFVMIPGLWRALYCLHLKLDLNWLSQTYTRSDLSGHTDSIYCLQYDQDKIISGSRDQTIKVWDLKTNQCIKTLKGHKGSILSLQFDENYLITGSTDKTIIVWDIKTFEILRQIEGHQDSVLSVKFNKKYIVSSSKDHTICVWDLNTGALVRQLTETTAVANAIQIKGDTIVAGSAGK